MKNFILTSESVTQGHPDKLCDQISDAIVDSFLYQHPPCAVTAECAVANGVVFLSVLHGNDGHVDVSTAARRVIAEAGYRDGPFASDTCTVLTNTNAVADPDLDFSAAGARAHHAVTAFGYACRHTPNLMPYSIWCAHNISRALDAARHEQRLDNLLPDGQAQIAVAFRDRKPVDIVSIILTTASRDEPSAHGDERLFNDITEHVIRPAFDAASVAPTSATDIYIRRAKPLHTGGPSNHAGLTGRKIADDGYGGYARLTATGMSGKDPSRIDRIATYAARHVAKCIVAAGLAEECEVQLSYGIGSEQPLNLEVDTFESGTTGDSQLSARIREVFDLRVGAIIERFDLWNATTQHNGRFFQKIAVYGQIGREDIAAPWEDTALAAKF